MTVRYRITWSDEDRVSLEDLIARTTTRQGVVRTKSVARHVGVPRPATSR